MMKKEAPHYVEIFERRGTQYAEACRVFRSSMAQELSSLLAWAEIRPGEAVLDVPAASGYLSEYLVAIGARLSAVDPSPRFHALCREVVPDSHCAPMTRLPFAAREFDVVLSHVGLHHEVALEECFAEVRRVLRPDGRFVFAEVDEGSLPGHFLNGFVHRHSTLGHVGHFFCDRYRHALDAAGLRIEREGVPAYHWVFASLYDLTRCLALMFGIDRASPAEIEAAVRDLIGIDEHADGSVGMRWCLRQVVCRPLATIGKGK